MTLPTCRLFTEHQYINAEFDLNMLIETFWSGNPNSTTVVGVHRGYCEQRSVFCICDTRRCVPWTTVKEPREADLDRYIHTYLSANKATAWISVGKVANNEFPQENDVITLLLLLRFVRHISWTVPVSPETYSGRRRLRKNVRSHQRTACPPRTLAVHPHRRAPALALALALASPRSL